MDLADFFSDCEYLLANLKQNTLQYNMGLIFLRIQKVCECYQENIIYKEVRRKRIMDKFEFKKNLIQVLNEECVIPQNVRFIITTEPEMIKKHTSKDDFMRLSIFNENNIIGRLFDIEQIVQMFSGLAPLFPLWIKVYFKSADLVELKTSLRFRKPSEIKYQETGHPPFVVCKNI